MAPDSPDQDAPAKPLTEKTRVSLPATALLVAVFSILTGAGTIVTFKTTSESKDQEHDRNIADHEGRLRKLENDVVGGMAEIKAELRGISEQLKRSRP